MNDQSLSERTTYVYVISHNHEYYKVGVSFDPLARLEQLQTGNPIRLQIAALFAFESRELAYEIERLIHQKLDRLHVMRGYGKEWLEADESFWPTIDYVAARLGAPVLAASGISAGVIRDAHACVESCQTVQS